MPKLQSSDFCSGGTVLRCMYLPWLGIRVITFIIVKSGWWPAFYYYFLLHIFLCLLLPYKLLSLLLGVPLEIFVNGELFGGTCYSAANWLHVGYS